MIERVIHRVVFLVFSGLISALWLPVAPEVAKWDWRTSRLEMLLFAMDSTAYKSLDWLGTGVLNSICLEMDKERLILDKDYELIFFQKGSCLKLA